MVIRGAVYRIDLGSPRGHEQGGRRYGLVLSPSEMPWSVVTVVPTSTSAAAAVFRPEIEVAGERTVILVDQIRTIDIDYVVGEPVDFLHHEDLATVERAVVSYLGLL
ncbi:type II toxin-antitoxin system PemK/MazF family toxin [Cellulosimicrobium marinum]|nr:type II toxin-antitoxin system PemK/MazF family toxin [Cellulosimicrobium marinum]